MSHATDIVGWAYEGDVHCNDCAEARFPDLLENNEGTDEILDSEGNPVSPIFDSEAYEECFCCGGDGKHPKKCAVDGEYDCEDCGGGGSRPRGCGDCGKELV